MLRASVRPWLPGRAPSLALGTLLLGGMLAVLASRGAAQNPAKAPAKDPPAKEPVKDPFGKPKGEPAKHVTLALHKDSASDVFATVKTINEKLEKGWAENNVTPSRQATDAEFLRRATLDIVGRIAKPSEIEQFYRDPEATRRSLLIDRLLAHEDYARHWANIWSNWLLSRSGTFGRGMYHDQMTVWLEDQFAQNKPYNELVTALLTAQGKNTDNGAVNFLLAWLGEEIKNTQLDKERVQREGRWEMVPVTARVTRLFLGTQVQCAQCHDHPFLGNLKQNQFWGVNAFLRQVDRKGAPAMNMRGTNPPLELVDDAGVNTRPLAYYEKRNGVILRQRAEFLPSGPKKESGEIDEGVRGIDRRRKLAEFVTTHDNFPRAAVNRMWGVFFGRGFVNPVDDFNDQTKPTANNDELLNEIAGQFKHYNYDLKKLIRWVCNSEAYNLSCVANKTNDKPEKEVLFSRMLLKSMTPEQLFESLMLATNSEAAESKEGKRELRNRWLEGLISNFGDDEGNEVNFNGTVVQALMMMNGKEINDAITRKDKGTVDMAFKTSRSSEEVIAKLYLATLNRRPTAHEIAAIHEMFHLADPKNQKKDNEKDNLKNRYYDLFWALLNSGEFLLNH